MKEPITAVVQSSSVVQEIVKASPSLTATGAIVFLGFPLSEWLVAATIIYTGLQTYILVRDKIFGPWRAEYVARKSSRLASQPSHSSGVPGGDNGNGGGSIRGLGAPSSVADGGDD